MKSRNQLTLTVVALAAAVVAIPHKAAAQPVCSNATLSGQYGYNRLGIFTNGDVNSGMTPEAKPARYKSLGIFANGGGGVVGSVGHFTADGAGHITSFTETFSLNGAVFSEGTVTSNPARNFYAGIYTVNADCTGYFDLHNSISSNIGWYNFVLEKGNTELHFVGTNPGSEIFGKAVFEGPSSLVACTAVAVAGPWGAQAFGLYISQTSGVAISADIALWNFDGVGSVASTEGTDSTDLITTQGITSFRGTYTTTSDCAGLITLPGASFEGSGFATVYYVLVNNNTQMLFMNTGSLSLSIGSANHQ